MNRDGYNTSLWQETPDYTPVNNSNTFQQELFDVIVAGGGITGLTTALELQRAGQKCLLLEARSIGFGTTAGTTAHLNTLLDTDYSTIQKDFDERSARLVAQAARQAIATIQTNILAYGMHCGFREVAGYTYAEDETQAGMIDDIYQGATQVGLPIEYTQELPVAMPFVKAVKYAGQAKFNPTCYITGLARAFEEAGGRIVTGCRVEKVEEAEAVKVFTTTGEWRCSKFVWATHVPPGISLFSFRCAPYRSYAIAVQLTDPAQEFEGLIYDSNDPYYYYRMQEVNGVNYLIAGGEDHKTGHEENTEKCFLQLEARVRKFFSFDTISYKWSSQYYESTDGLPYIGLMPGGSSRQYVATGFGGNGMIYGTISGIILSNLIVTGESEYKDLFDPVRIKPIAEFSNFVKENFDVAKEYISALFQRDKLESLSDLAHGEAKVIRYDGQKVGIYKDEAGELHVVNPTCTHAKCTIGWNSSERSWDCPCHGARFDCDGNVITSPATEALKRITIQDAVTI